MRARRLMLGRGRRAAAEPIDPDLLLRAYSVGVFPMADSHDAPDIFWVEPKKRGVLPLAGLVGAMPIVGIAPIMVMWFGFDWQSKAAVAAVMTFFPMLVNTLAGLAATSSIERDLMRSYGAGYAQTLLTLRLPAAMPFVFNALKLTFTLALIGAIVAEFFGTPIVGMGFRISTEAARLDLDIVWAEIALAALTGSAAFAALAWLESRTLFWHPSFQLASTEN